MSLTASHEFGLVARHSGRTLVDTFSSLLDAEEQVADLCRGDPQTTDDDYDIRPVRRGGDNWTDIETGAAYDDQTA